MLYEEFKELTQCNVSYEAFEHFETQYMMCDMTKDVFCKTVKTIAKQIERTEREKTMREFYKENAHFCGNGNVIYKMYVVLGVDVKRGKHVVQYTGFCGCGLPDRQMNIIVKKGIATLTKAEKEQLRTMDTWESLTE